MRSDDKCSRYFKIGELRVVPLSLGANEEINLGEFWRQLESCEGENGNNEIQRYTNCWNIRESLGPWEIRV